MKKILAMLLVILTLTMSVLPIGTAFAVTNDACNVCYTGLVDYSCSKGSYVQISRSTHEYGLLWDRKTCNVIWYYRWAEQSCIDCGHVFKSQMGPHECVEVHNDCGKGTKSCCPYRATFTGS